MCLAIGVAVRFPGTDPNQEVILKMGQNFIERKRGKWMVISFPDDYSGGVITFHQGDEDLRSYLDRLSFLKMAVRVEIFGYQAGHYRLAEVKHLEEV